MSTPGSSAGPRTALITGAGTGIGRRYMTGQAVNVTGGLWMH